MQTMKRFLIFNLALQDLYLRFLVAGLAFQSTKGPPIFSDGHPGPIKKPAGFYAHEKRPGRYYQGIKNRKTNKSTIGEFIDQFLYC